MSITKQKDGRYKVSVRPQGADGPRLQRLVKTRSQAVQLHAELSLTKHSKHDNDTLSNIVTLWFTYFGSSLKDGEKRYNKLLFLVNLMGDIHIKKLRPYHYMNFRKQRLNDGLSKNTCNHDLAYLKTVFNKLNKAGYITVNPFKDIAPLKIDEPELTYLTSYQIKRLLVSCRYSRNESLFPLVLFCLRTGARWSEAQNLTIKQLTSHSVTFTKTKSGKNRTVPLYPEFTDYLLSRHHINNRVFQNCYKSFVNAVNRARIELPKGQMTHVLRHTYASHQVMNGCDIFLLQELLGHSDVKQTMKYAHLSPNHLRDSLSYLAI